MFFFVSGGKKQDGKVMMLVNAENVELIRGLILLLKYSISLISSWFVEKVSRLHR